MGQGPTWTPQAVDELKRLWAEGTSTLEIAKRLSVSVRAIECKIYKLRARGRGFPRRTKKRDATAVDEVNLGAADQQARRRCLYCDENFDSKHSGNRICSSCLVGGPFTSAII